MNLLKIKITGKLSLFQCAIILLLEDESKMYYKATESYINLCFHKYKNNSNKYDKRFIYKIKQKPRIHTHTMFIYTFEGLY